MKPIIAAAALLFAGTAFAQDYVPPAGDESWERRDPASLGLDEAALEAAIAFAIDNETRHPPELEAISPARNLPVTVPLTWAFEPFSSPVGPLQARGEPSGVILRNGYIVAEWGEPERVDMTFSITKTFLSHVVGLAVEDGLIESVDDAVAPYVDDERFRTEHNAPITWDQLLRQTSGWWGTLFGKPAWADRPARDDPTRDLVAGPPIPGEHWEYNDVRVNALALAALHVHQRSLQDVVDERLMTPMGSTSDWRWHGYENSYVQIDGESIQSVSGGGHWGGGVFLTAYDLARLGLLGSRSGDWGGQQLLAEDWFEASLTPTDVAPSYGYMNFFLNRPGLDGASIQAPSAPETAFAYLGAGSNMVFISPEHDLVAVVRWIDRGERNAFIEQLMAAVEE
jgi:CubicO group peptidase (beta-lactamase class C family)